MKNKLFARINKSKLVGQFGCTHFYASVRILLEVYANCIKIGIYTQKSRIILVRLFLFKPQVWHIISPSGLDIINNGKPLLYIITLQRVLNSVMMQGAKRRNSEERASMQCLSLMSLCIRYQALLGYIWVSEDEGVSGVCSSSLGFIGLKY